MPRIIGWERSERASETWSAVLPAGAQEALEEWLGMQVGTERDVGEDCEPLALGGPEIYWVWFYVDLVEPGRDGSVLWLTAIEVSEL